MFQTSNRQLKAVGISLAALADYYVLDGIKGFGPQKFKELHECGLSPTDVNRLPTNGKRGDQFRDELGKNREQLREECVARTAKQLITAHKNSVRIVRYSDPHYPRAVFRSNNPTPILYVRGPLDVLRHDRCVACVGSRGIREPYSSMLDKFARHAVGRDFAVVSGFALGADTIGHKAAFQQHRQTIAVMPCGLDRPFPPENKDFFQDLLKYSKATFVSEFAFGTSAKALTLRKRNKLIVAFALGVLIGQLSVKGGTAVDEIHGRYALSVGDKELVIEFSPDSELRDTEQTPLLEDGGIEAFIRREVLPHAADAWYDEHSVKIGYEISFNRYFYKPQPLQPLEDIRADIMALEKETEGLLDEILGVASHG